MNLKSMLKMFGSVISYAFCPRDNEEMGIKIGPLTEEDIKAAENAKFLFRKPKVSNLSTPGC